MKAHQNKIYNHEYIKKNPARNEFHRLREIDLPMESYQTLNHLLHYGAEKPVGDKHPAGK